MVNHARRSLILGRASSPPPLRPPWTSDTTFLADCTGCGDCVPACAANLIAIGAGGYPELRPENGECTFCRRCAEACGAWAFDLARPAFGHTVAIGDDCLARSRIECRACEDACPEAAIRFRPQLRGPAEPVLDDALCTGCGGCLAQCPVGAISVRLPSREPANA